MNRRALWALAPLFASGCAAVPPANVLASADPTSPLVGIRNVHPAGVTGDYHARQAVDPKPWRRRDDEKAPQSGGDS